MTGASSSAYISKPSASAERTVSTQIDILEKPKGIRKSSKDAWPIYRAGYSGVNKLLQSNGIRVQVGLENDSSPRGAITEVISAVDMYRPDAGMLATYIRLGGACMALHWANTLVKLGSTRSVTQRQRDFETDNVTGVVEDYLKATSLVAPQAYPLSTAALGWLLQSQLSTLRPARSSLTPDVVMHILRRAKETKFTIHALAPDVRVRGTPRLRTAEELRVIGTALRAGRYTKQFELVMAPAARREDLNNAFRADIVHFAGHGSGVDLVFNGDSMGQAEILSIVNLGNILKAGNSVKVVVLNACYSSQEAKYLSTVIPVVISMQGTVVDRVAIEFAKHFYQALANGADLLKAFDSGKSQAAAIPVDRGSDIAGRIADPFTPQFFKGGSLIAS